MAIHFQAHHYPLTTALEAGMRLCLQQAPEFTREQVLRGIDSGQYVPMVRGESFVILEVYHDPHFQCRCLNLFMAYSPPEIRGFMASIAPEIIAYAAEHDCTKIVCQTYVDGYQGIIDAGKGAAGVKFTPYLWRYLLESSG